MTEATSPVSGLQNDAEEINLADVLDTLLQHIWLVIGVFLFVFALGIGYAFLATPIYNADALIQVEQRKSTTLSSVQEIADTLGASSSPVSGEMEILTSREVILKAAAAIHADVAVEPYRFPVIGGWLARKYSNGELAPSWLGLSGYGWGGESIRVDEFQVPDQSYGKQFILIATETGYRVEDGNGNNLSQGAVGQVLTFPVYGGTARLYVAELVARPGTRFSLVRFAPIEVYRRIRSGLTVEEAGRQSSVIRVSFRHPNVNFAKDLVNAIAKAYLTQNVERRSAEADQSLRFLDEQLPVIKRNVERAEEALNNFRTKTNTVSVEKSIDVLLQQSVEVEKERLQLQLKRDELRQLYQPEHPELKALESQIAAINERGKNINERVNRLPGAQRDLLRLQRDAEVANQLYIALLNNAQQLKIAKAGTIGNVRIVDFALADIEPVEPKKGVIIGASALLGLLLGAGGAFVARWLRPTVRDMAEVERSTGLVAYVSIPESPAQSKLDSAKRGRGGRAAIVPGRNQLLAALVPDDMAIESLRSLRTGLTFAMLGAANKTIVITGATAALGKSFISANLAALLAIGGKRVLLVETDMRRPQLGAYFGQLPVNGLSEVLAGAATFEEAVVCDAANIKGLDVLFSGLVPPNPGELLLSEKFKQIIENKQSDYDYIILDSAPVLPVGDTLAVGRLASTVFLIVRAEVTTKGEIRDAIRKLESSGIAIKGFIFNGVKRHRVGYGSAYRYYYGYGKNSA